MARHRKGYRGRVRQFERKVAKLERSERRDPSWIEELMENVLPDDHPGLRKNGWRPKG